MGVNVSLPQRLGIKPKLKDDIDALELDFATKYVNLVVAFGENAIFSPLLKYSHYLLMHKCCGHKFYFTESSKYFTFNVEASKYYFDFTVSDGQPLNFNDLQKNSPSIIAVRAMHKLVKCHKLPIISNIDGNEKYDLSASCLSLNKVVKSVAEKRLQELLQYTPENITKINAEIATISENIRKSQMEILQPHLSYIQLQDIINNATVMQTRLDELTRLAELAKKNDANLAKHINNLQKFIPMLITEQSGINDVIEQPCNKPNVETVPPLVGLLHSQEVRVEQVVVSETTPNIYNAYPDVPTAIPVIYPDVPTGEIIQTATVLHSIPTI